MEINKIKAHFKKLGFEISLTHHPMFHNVKSKYAWCHWLKWERGSAVARLMNLCEYYFGDVRVADTFGSFLVKTSDFKLKGHKIKGICKKCGCTSNDACVEANKKWVTCYWVKEDLCSECK